MKLNRKGVTVGLVGLGLVGCHDLLPVGVILVLHKDADGRPQRLPETYTRQELTTVRFDKHPRAPAIPFLTASEIGVYIPPRKTETGGDPIQDAYFSGSVRFARGRHYQPAHSTPLRTRRLSAPP